MSQKSAPKPNIRPRVSSGIPWWIWVALCVVGGGIGFSLFQNAIAEDPAKLFADAMLAAQNKDGKLIESNLEKLKQFPEFAGQQKLLEGMLMLNRSRPLKAIPMLQEASEEKAVRGKALMYLGIAYAQAEDSMMAIKTFESAIQDDENAFEARHSMAMMLNDMMAWEEALTHLNFLAEKEYKPAQILKTRGDILFDLGKYKEAAADLEAAIKADQTDPMNSVKADRLIQSLTRLGDHEKVTEFVGLIDRPGANERLEAETLFAAGNTSEIFEVLDRILREAPNDARAAQIYAQTMLKQKTAEKAAEALVIIRPLVTSVTRNLDLYKSLAELSRMAGDDEVAGLAQQNVEQLTELNSQYDAALAATIRTRDEYEPRFKLAELALETGQLEQAMKYCEAVSRLHPEKAAEIDALKQRVFTPLPQLVSTETASADAASNGATSTPAVPESPAEQKPDAEPATPAENPEPAKSDAASEAAPDAATNAKSEASTSPAPEAESVEK